MANFKGFKQVSLATYNGLGNEEKKNYLWLVRDLSGDTVVSSAIYFGTRKYAEVNDAVTEKVDRLINGLASIVDENGDFVGFMSEGHELLSSANSLTELFEILENAVLANEAEIAEKADKTFVEGELAKKADATEVQAKIDELNTKLEETASAVQSGLTQDLEAVKGDVAGLQQGLADTNAAVATKAEQADLEKVSAKADALETIASAITEELGTKADADKVYTKDEIDAKIVGLFHFVGEAESVSEDGTKIVYKGQEIVASEANVGEVYQIGDAEYASNGTSWIKLGFNIDLSPYATKEEVAVAVNELESGLTTTQAAIVKEIEEREKLADEVVDVKNTLTTTANTFEDAEQLGLKLGQIVYVLNQTENSGVTYYSGAYIKTQDGLKKLDSTTPSADATIGDRVESLELRTGTQQTAIENLTTLIGAEKFEGNSVSEAIAALQADNHTLIEGDDVEE